MQHIRLTCGECNKRYRLPTAARGYFRCRHCDLVMPIPDSGSVILGPPEEFDEEISEIGFDPNTNEPIHLQTSGQDEQQLEIDDADENEAVYGAHVKKQVERSPADSALTFVGAGLAASGLFVLCMQLSHKVVADRSMIVASMGFASVILGAALLLYGLRGIKKVGWAVGCFLALLSLVMFCVLLTAPPDQIEDNAKRRGIDPATLEPDSSPFSLGDVRKNKGLRSSQTSNQNQKQQETNNTEGSDTTSDKDESETAN